MKTRFNTFDIVCIITELQKLIGMRVNNVYDIDNKAYLIRLQKSDEKVILLLESGNRIHITNFEWPKNIAPSGFSMKLRKHLRNKRLESLTQLGTDRIIDLQFGSGEAAYHIILELYDKGNIILTDFEFVILNVLRPHTEGDTVKFVVREKYPQNRARESEVLSKEQLLEILKNAKPGDQLKKVLVPHVEYGPALTEHVLLKQGFSSSTKIGKTFNVEESIEKLMNAIFQAEELFQNGRKAPSKGFIIQKKEARPATNANDKTEFYSNQEFHPMLFEQHSSSPFKEFESFNTAVDEFCSSMESQKLEMRAVHQEREAMKKLENVRKDHDQRLGTLEKTQEVDKQKAELITRNQELIDRAILSIQTLLANQMSWEDIGEMVKEAANKGDEVAKQIKSLKLETNHISLFLTDPYGDTNNSDASDGNDDTIPSMIVDIDLALTAFANARRYYDKKRSAAKKQQKTIESQNKALKSAERKTKQTLKEVQTITNINKVRKVFWFEKFYWFISSENYLVIAGRDQQQNELIVKRYLRPTDVYVHADVHGASSIIIKNPSGQPIPPKTLNEAGTMAICYSVAWEAKVITNAYWVWGDQVSKTAPTGEYLQTGSFMVRGKKNFLPPSHLILGLSFLFRVEDSFIEKHMGERKVLTQIEEDALTNAQQEVNVNEVEVEILDESDEDELKQDDINNIKEIQKGEVEDQVGDSTESESETKFPDTQIRIQHLEGTKIHIVTESKPLDEEDEDSFDDENVVYLGDDKPIVLNSTEKSRNRGNSESSGKQRSDKGNNRAYKKESVQQQTKRGQKSKLKKIKEKYKDQDEEERKMRMEILQSSGCTNKDAKKSKRPKDGQSKPFKKTEHSQIPKQPQLKDPQEYGNEDEEQVVQANVDMINSLTGIPLPEDELLFAVPVVAPYNTLANYKFKVKLTPGTGKRGKAARTAVSMFLKDRNSTQREKDLLKAVKDEQLARNLPGKVKLSAPKMQINKK